MSADGACELCDKAYVDAPALVVEVHSPATATRDKREKFAIYESSGVSEYWMIDPYAHHAEIWQRVAEQFHRLGIYRDSETFASSALGKAVKLAGEFNE